LQITSKEKKEERNIRDVQKKKKRKKNAYLTISHTSLPIPMSKLSRKKEVSKKKACHRFIKNPITDDLLQTLLRT